MNLVSGGVAYSSKGKLDAFTQLHIARKLGPALTIVDGLVRKENFDKEKHLLIVLMLSHISDENTEFVIHKCLSVVMREQVNGQYAPVQTPAGALMFDDMTMTTILELTVEIIEENLGDFFRTALERLNQATAT